MEHNNAGNFWCIVEDIKVPTWKSALPLKEKWGITEGMGRRVKNLTDNSEKPSGQWNTMTVECYKNFIRVR